MGIYTGWWLSFILIILISFGTRLHNLEKPDHVCWDETHFGKMGSWYINGTFFFDVHPPLGKMLIAASGKLTGYDGTFGWTAPGEKFGDTKYIGMRLFCVSLGTMIIPFTFLIIWEMTKSLTASVLASCLIIFDIGFLTLSQYILLDPILLFFIVGSFLGSVKFNSMYEKPFSLFWWFWLIWTGVFLSSAISVKFVGLFVVLLAGLRTIDQLWKMLGEQDLPIRMIIKHFIYRTCCLICLPIALYMLYFWIHIKLLYKTGSGDGFFSSAFQSQLEGNSLYNASMPQSVAFGAVITLKNHRTGGGYLHSHYHLYPEGTGARQQQVTAYSHKDENNKWLIKKYDNIPPLANDTIEIVKNGDLVRLEHVVTGRNLHSHKEFAPVTTKHYQVSCYGENGTGDANDVWRIDLVGSKEGQPVETLTGKVRIVHYLVGCALGSQGKQLPKWGYEQMEVSCNPNVYDKHNYWNVEDNVFNLLPNVSVEIYAPSFLEIFMESHAVMLQGNAGLKPKEGEVTSKPLEWPINYRGQFFSGNDMRIYLLGNPVIWWGNLVLTCVYIVLQLSISIRNQRGCSMLVETKNQDEIFTDTGKWLFIGWSIHYFPFFVMGRVLYYHHYFPALVFSSMLSGVVVDHLLSKILLLLNDVRLSKSIFHLIFGSILGILGYSFYLFSPLSYGITKSNDTSNGISELKWLSSWEF